MTAPGNSALLVTLLAAFIACTGYAAGRLHQWYRTGLDRDEAFRDGYDTATRSVFGLAARIIAPRRGDRAAISASAAVIVPSTAVVEGSAEPLPAAGPSGRHQVPDELVQAPTYRLPPDRVARAKVHGAAGGIDAEIAARPTTRITVPKPRSS
ncbi:hypothetical protein [Krasilnikovia sp. M28-CT-15]|uniref:hypothetical protein n=1 Tax=Krasilnikovia sp. M28-CT-15 TaxID=3373540 RepID=UPI003876A84D